MPYKVKLFVEITWGHSLEALVTRKEGSRMTSHQSGKT